MILRKIRYKVTSIAKSINRRSGNFEINWGYWLFSVICLAFIGLLGINIFRIVRKGYERYEIIREENSRLSELQRENEALKEELKYYSSTEFIDVKAREELNMVFPNQRLIYIEREKVVALDEEEEEEEEITPSWKLWYNLIF